MPITPERSGAKWLSVHSGAVSVEPQPDTSGTRTPMVSTDRRPSSS